MVVTRLKGNASLWWDSVQEERRRRNNPLIKIWDRMVENMRDKFFPKYYQLILYREVQNLRQILLMVREYTEEFYKVNLRAGYVEESTEKAARYVNGLRMDIQEDTSMISLRTMEEAYKCALRAEEKIMRKQSFNRGHGSARARGQATIRGRFGP